MAWVLWQDTISESLMKIEEKLLKLESGNHEKTYLFKIKGHNSKIPDAIWLIIEFGLHIVARHNFRKFGED